jgi:hypothetical protein
LTHNLAAWALAYELGDSAVRDHGIVEELSALLQAPVANHGTAAMYRIYDVSAFVREHVVLTQARQCVRDEVMNFLSRNMAQVEVFIQQIKFPSLHLPGQCDVRVGQVHMVSLQDEVTIVE